VDYYNDNPFRLSREELHAMEEEISKYQKEYDEE